METIWVSELKLRTIPFHHDSSRLSWSVKIKYQSSGKPGCYPDRSTPRVCRVLFQPRICLRTITCLELAVKNMVGSGSQKHKQEQQSWPFLPTSSFVVIWRVMTTSNKTQLHTSIQARDLSLRWYNAAFFLSVQVQSPSLSRNLQQQSERTVWYVLLVRHYQLSWEKKTPLLFLVTSRARENYPVCSHTQTHLHIGCRHSHTTHTCCPWVPGRGWRVHSLLM